MKDMIQLQDTKQSVLVNKETIESLKHIFQVPSLSGWRTRLITILQPLIANGHLDTMGIIFVMIAQGTERVATLFTMQAVLRRKCKKIVDISKDKGRPITHYVRHEVTGLSRITVKLFPALEPSHCHPADHVLKLIMVFAF